MHSKNIKYFLYIPLEFILVIFILILGIKIFNLKNDNFKRIYVTKINRDDVVFSSQSSKLKYFYEPKANKVEISHPEWLGYDIRNTINYDTLNERYNYDLNKNIRTFRIITLGDSFTFGQFVNTTENFSEVLEDLLQSKIVCTNYDKYEVINLGVWNYDITYSIERLKKRGIKYNPDVVLWLIPDTDFERKDELKIPLDKQLIQSGIQSFDPVTGLYPASEKSRKMINTILGDEGYYKYQEASLTNLNKVYSGNLVFLTFSSLSRKYLKLIDETIKLNDNYSHYELKFNLNDKSLRLLDHHPNKEGHKVIANELFNYLKDKYFRKCTVKK